MNRRTFSSDKNWADTFTEHIKTIVKSFSSEIIDVVITPEQDDIKHATDYIVKVKGGTIACRVRALYFHGEYGDFTLRYERASGTKTECEKIKEGYADWYLYCWGDKPIISFYILIDLDKLRENWWIVDDAPIIPNKDGITFFKAIPLTQLQQIDAITKTNFGISTTPIQKRLW